MRAAVNKEYRSIYNFKILLDLLVLISCTDDVVIDITTNEIYFENMVYHV